MDLPRAILSRPLPQSFGFLIQTCCNFTGPRPVLDPASWPGISTSAWVLNLVPQLDADWGASCPDASQKASTARAAASPFEGFSI
jgi:hypothetical protein